MASPLDDLMNNSLNTALDRAMSSVQAMLGDNIKALLSHWRQTDRLWHLSIPGATTAAPLMPEQLTGIEALSPIQCHDVCIPAAARSRISTDIHGFEFTLTVLSTDAHLQAADFIGQPALIELQTAHSRTDRRPIHGILTAFHCLGANGGLARYQLTLKPWLSWLGQRYDNYVYTDATVIDIAESIFGDYAAPGSGGADQSSNDSVSQVQWRTRLKNPEAFSVRSLTTQYGETDLQFLTRLFAEEGLFYFFEHSKEGHTLILTDDSSQFVANEQGTIRFTQSSAVQSQDSIRQWQAWHQVQPSRIELQSWDYRSLNTRAVVAETTARIPLTLQIEPGSYSYADRQQGQRLADTLLQGFNARRQGVQGQGSVRTLRVGTTFQLTEHAVDHADPYAVLSVWHEARNNVDVKIQGKSVLNGVLPSAVGRVPHPASDNTNDDLTTAHCQPLLPAWPALAHPCASYTNHFTALTSTIAYQSASTLHGKALYPSPTARGTQTATVVGDEHTAVHTDRDHRVQIQYHWQRGSQGSSLSAHPSTDDNGTGRSKGQSGGLWVRVISADAGDNHGAVWLPRVGQEVIVAFQGNDIDRPVIVGSVYNGQGASDAQYNQVSTGRTHTSGNAPAWFAGNEGTHAHHAVFSGFKTQALNSSHTGHGGYNQLVMDNTPAQPGVRLHATPSATTTSQLNLGTLIHQQDNQRHATRGYGSELTTPYSGALRGGSGVLLTTDAATPGQEHLASNATSLLQATQGNQRALNQHASQQHAALPGVNATQLDDALLKQLTDKLTTTQVGGEASSSPSPPVGAGQAEGATPQPKSADGGQGEATAYSHPVMVLSSPAGMASFSAQHTIEVTGTQRISHAQHRNLTAQKDSLTHTAQGQVWYTAGQPHADAPIKETGIKLHAATGNVELKALSSQLNLNADQHLNVGSVQGTVKVSAPNNTLLLTAGGAFIELKQGQLTLGAPGNITLSGSQVSYTSPQGASDSIMLAQSKVKGCGQQNAPALDAIAPF